MAFDHMKCFCAGNCVANNAIALNNKHDIDNAIIAARRAVLSAPNCPYAHGILGFMMGKTDKALYAERHIRLSKALGDHPTQADTVLGFSFIERGDIAAAERSFMEAIAFDVNHWPAHAGLAKVAELQGDYDKALTLAGQAYAVDPKLHDLRVLYAKLLARADRTDEALAALASSTDSGELFERGAIHERLGDYEKAFTDFTLANRLSGKVYDNAEALLRISNHKAFCTANQMGRLPSLQTPLGVPFTPLFIAGYPRSGTTLVEAMLSAHPKIQAGDELKHLHTIASHSQAWLGADEVYPFSLRELEIGDKNAVLRSMRAFYVSKVCDFLQPGKTYVTDKMPLNEMHLPLISMLFPEAPILYVRRNPLDIIISNYSHYLTHGFNQSFDLVSCATHYARVDDLLQHYKRKLELNFREVRYEELVAQPQFRIGEVLEFAALPSHPDCARPELNKHHARTPSYEAVKKPVNDRSIGRWRHFERHMGAAIKIVEPILKREGY